MARKTFTYPLMLLFFSWCASCRTDVHTLYVDEEDKKTTPQVLGLARQYPMLTLASNISWASAFDAAMVAGASHARSKTYANIVEAQLKAGSSEAYATAYAEQLALGKAPRSAAAYADKEEETRAQWTDTILINAYSAAL